MKQIFVAAWVGIVAGWMGFGWVLAEAPTENGRAVAAQAEMQPVGLASLGMGVDILAEPDMAARLTAKEPVRTEPNLRG